jgi:hypothetical protein
MSALATRVSRLEAKPPPDRALSERLARAEARERADCEARGVPFAPWERLELPPELTGLAERLCWARAQRDP